MRRILMTGVAVVVLAGAGAGPAAAAPKKKKPTIAVTSVRSHAGAKITAAERFKVTGAVHNRGRKASQALLSASLRRNGRTVFVLGAHNLRRVRGRHSRKFTIAATGPVLPARTAAKRYPLLACVRRRRGARSACRRARRSVLVVPASGGTPGTGGAPGTGTPGAGSPAPSP